MSPEDRNRLARRIERLAMLGQARAACAEMIQRLNDGTASRLPENQQYLFDKVSDPYLALSRTVMALGRIVALEDRLDESDEERAKRLAAEAAEREQARKAEEARQERVAAHAVESARRSHIRRAVDLAHREVKPDMRPIDRVTQIDRLFDGFGRHVDFSRDPVEIVADLCAQLGFRPIIPPGGPKKANNGTDYADWVRRCTLETARAYLNRTSPDEPDTDSAPAAPPPRSQGPPNG